MSSLAEKVFKTLMPEIIAGAEVIAKTPASKIRELNEEKINRGLEEISTDLLYAYYGARKPRSYEDLIKGSEFPIYSFAERPQDLGPVLSKFLHQGIAAFLKLHTSGTVRHKYVYIPLDRMPERMASFIALMLRHGLGEIMDEDVLLLGNRKYPTYGLMRNFYYIFKKADLVDILGVIEGTEEIPTDKKYKAVVTIPTYLNLALKRGLKLADEPVIIYSSEPMPVYLAKKLEELGAKIFSYYGSSEFNIIGFGPEGNIELATHTHEIVAADGKEIKFIYDVEDDSYVEVYFTENKPPIIANVSLGDMLHVKGTSALGYKLVDYIARASKIVENYPLPPRGSARVIITPQFRHYLFFIPVVELKQILLSRGIAFLALYLPKKNRLVLITDKEVPESVKEEILEKNKPIAMELEKQSFELVAISCPEALEKFLENMSKKRYEALIIEERREFNEEAPCAEYLK